MKEHSKRHKLPHPAPLNALDHARPGGISTFMRLPHINDPEELDIALVGLPHDGAAPTGRAPPPAQISRPDRTPFLRPPDHAADEHPPRQLRSAASATRPVRVGHAPLE